MNQDKLQNKIKSFLDLLKINLKNYKTTLHALSQTIHSQGIKFASETLPTGMVSRSNSQMIQSTSSDGKLEDIDLCYLLLHEYYHVLEGVHKPLIIEEGRNKETADYFAEAVVLQLFKGQKSKFTYLTKTITSKTPNHF